jgi:hypothetical protein
MRTAITMLLALVSACAGIDDPVGLTEPFVADQADFKRGALPSGTAEGPAITLFTPGFGTLRPGARAAAVTGNASGTAYSVGIRFADLGSGYWVRPVGSLDPIAPGELTWSLAIDANSEIEPGQHELEVVAFDVQGRPGPKRTATICVASSLPDNLNACNPKLQPPLVVASLTWNTDADLDISLVAPDGTQFNRGKRALAVDGKPVVRLDADGVTGCVADGRRSENFVFDDVPPQRGAWSVYANLFDACGKAAASFELTIYQRTTHADGTFALTPVSSVGGDFLRQQANGGAAAPLYLTSIVF